MLEDIKSDIKKLIAAYEREKAENERISIELKSSNEQLLTCKKQIIELYRQIDNMKLKNAFLATSGDAGAKAKIDRLIKDIDKCLALLEG